MKILIFEDNQDDLTNLLDCINNFFSTTDIEYTIQTCSEAKYVFENHINYNLIFLDVEVAGENGIEVGCEVRKINRDIKLIFVTSHSKYLIDGYKAQANRYFIKPIQQDDFNFEIKNVIVDYLEEYNGFFDKTISNKKIHFKQIIYIEFSGRKTSLHFLSGKIISTNYSLKYWCEKLENNGFSQPYKSLLINLKHISGFTKTEIILDNEETLPISRLYRQKFEAEYLESLHEWM